MKNYILITVVAIGLYFMLKPGPSRKSAEVTPPAELQDVLAVKEADESTPSILPEAPPKRNLGPVVDDVEATAKNNMHFMLTKLAECTEIKNSVFDNPEPALNAILDSVQTDLGEPVIRSEDWTSTEVRLTDGSRRVIRLETVYEDEDIVKRLKYYHVMEQGLVPQELSPEQSKNPTDSFLGSLEKDGEIVAREKSERVFFQNGEELMYVERNGRILNTEIIRAGKSLKCGDYGQKNFRCQCF